MRIPIISGAIDSWLNWSWGRSVRFDAMATQQLMAQVKSAYSEVDTSLTQKDLRSRGWVFAGQRQIGGRGGRVPIQLIHVRESESRIRNPDPSYLRTHHQDRVKIFDHPFLDLYNKPNKDESGLVFHWRQLAQLNSAGRAYVLCTPEVFDIIMPKDEKVNEAMVVSRIQSMRLLDPDRVTVIPSKERVAGSFKYSSVLGGIEEYPAPPANTAERRKWKSDPKQFVFSIVLPDAASYTGYGPHKAGSDSMTTLAALGTFHKNQLRNGIHSGMIFYLMTKEADPQRFAQMVMLLKAGIGKAGEPLVLPKGRFEVEKSPVTGQDMQFAELNTIARQEALAVIGASDATVGLAEDLNRANIWGLEHALAVGTIDPLNELIADAYNAWLLPLYPGQSRHAWFEAEYSSSRMVDEIDQAGVLTTLVKGLILTPNEARADIGRKPLPGGDKLVTMTSGPAIDADGNVADETLKVAEEEKDPPEEDRSRSLDLDTDEGREAKWRSLIASGQEFEDQFAEDLGDIFRDQGDAVIGMITDLGAALIDAAEDEFAEDDEERNREPGDVLVNQIWDGEGWAEVMVEALGRNVSPAMVAMFISVASDIGLSGPFSGADERIKTYVSSRGFEYVTQINETTRKRIRELLKETIAEGGGAAVFAAKLRVQFDEWAVTRAAFIARNEVNMAQNWANFDALEEGVKVVPEMRHMWLSARDLRVRDTHRKVDGKVRKIGKKFRVGACLMRHPQDVVNCLDASETILCRCRTAPVFPGDEQVISSPAT